MVISLLVVLYNKEIHESKTLVTLLNTPDENLKLTIINNGPVKLNDISNDDIYKSLLLNFLEVKVIECINNAPLSIIYNDFILNDHKSSAYVIFDDDSHIPNDYIYNVRRRIPNCKIDLLLPKIYGVKDQKCHYPLYKGTIVEEDDIFTGKRSGDIISIGSGLVIFRSLVSKFASAKLPLFDERFALYGVDYSLFRNIKKYVTIDMNISIEICGVLTHDLSSGAEKQEAWRIKERLIDHVLSARYYSSSKLKCLLSLTKFLFNELFNLRLGNVIFIILIILKGKHPRC